MGNRATVIFTDGKKSFSPAVYLHWNGGPESVYGFLAELDRRKVRTDQDYECARFIELVGEFFDLDEFYCNSLGVTNGPKSDLIEDLSKVETDHGNNGFYLVNRTNGKMQVRRFREEYQHEPFKCLGLKEIDSTEVAKEREEAYNHKYGLLKEEFIKVAHGRQVSKFG